MILRWKTTDRLTHAHIVLSIGHQQLTQPDALPACLLTERAESSFGLPIKFARRRRRSTSVCCMITLLQFSRQANPNEGIPSQTRSDTCCILYSSNSDQINGYIHTCIHTHTTDVACGAHSGCRCQLVALPVAPPPSLLPSPTRDTSAILVVSAMTIASHTLSYDTKRQRQRQRQRLCQSSPLLNVRIRVSDV